MKERIVKKMSVDLTVPFGAVRDAFMNLVTRSKGEGASYDCPCCGQHAKIYSRKIHRKMAQTLIKLYQLNILQNKTWVSVDEIYSKGQAGDYAKLRFWGFAESVDTRKAHNNASGLWRITDAGKGFVEGNKAPKYALVYDNTCIGLEGDLVTIGQCLGEPFDFTGLMAR